MDSILTQSIYSKIKKQWEIWSKLLYLNVIEILNFTSCLKTAYLLSQTTKTYIDGYVYDHHSILPKSHIMIDLPKHQ